MHLIPDILRLIANYADQQTRASLRQTCKMLKEHVDKDFCTHPGQYPFPCAVNCTARTHRPFILYKHAKVPSYCFINTTNEISSAEHFVPINEREFEEYEAYGHDKPYTMLVERWKTTLVAEVPRWFVRLHSSWMSNHVYSLQWMEMNYYYDIGKENPAPLPDFRYAVTFPRKAFVE